MGGPEGSMGQGRLGPMALKDQGLKDLPVGVYSRAPGRWGPKGCMGSQAS